MAGTINTTNYNFKKYAPDDTVSMLQTFNGNMDAIDKAIKDRADVETEQGASIAKLETGLSSTNDGLNSANQTISALQVQVTTNTRNIQNANTEIDSLDARVQALEDGGSAIENITLNIGKQPNTYVHQLHKQGNHYFGFLFDNYTNILSTDLTSITACDNMSVPNAFNIIKQVSINGNPFGLNPNIGHVIGVANERIVTSTTQLSDSTTLIALYDGNVTYIGTNGGTDVTAVNINAVIDFII